MSTAAFCEIDPYCRAVLRKHWPETPIYEDIRTLNSERLQADGIAFDIICGGFPCQPWSVGGARKGSDDDRHLWPEMLRLVTAGKPNWVIGENVPGLDDKRFMALDGVLSDLEAAGYESQTFEIPACAVNAPHQRKRLWIVANANGPELRQQSGRSCRQGGQGSSFIRNYGEAQFMAHANGNEQHWWGGAVQVGRPEVKGGLAQNCHTARTQWSVEPGIRRVAHGIPSRVDRLRSLGNSVVPQIVEEIGRAIMIAEGLGANGQE